MKDSEGKTFVYICPMCNQDVEGCPDPGCRGIGHHTDHDNPCKGNGEFEGDVLIKDCKRRYK